MQTEIKIVRLAPHRLGVVPTETRLRDIESLAAGMRPRHLLVVDGDNRVVGVLDRDRVRQTLTLECETARKGWEELPAGSLAVPLGPVSSPVADRAEPHAAQRPESIEVVNDCDGLVALLMDEKTFVEWRRVETAIARGEVDPVTDLPGRRAFEHRLREEIERAARVGHSLALFVLDVDHFKGVNDRHGHLAGDATLRAIGQKLRAGVRSYDFVARVGGDEFAVVCGGCPAAEFPNLIGRLLNLIVAPRATRGAEPDDLVSVGVASADTVDDLPVHAVEEAPRNDTTGMTTVSIGAALLTTVDRGCLTETLLQRADACLYRAKQAGRAAVFAVALDGAGNPLTEPHRIP